MLPARRSTSVQNVFNRRINALRGKGGLLLQCLLLAFLALASQAKAVSEATLEWNPNPEPDVTGYKLYYGTASNTYTRLVDNGSPTSATVPDLVAGFTYYFVVTAYNSAGLEGPPSNEVSFTVPWPAALQISYLPRPDVPLSPDTPIRCDAVEGGASGFSFRVTAVAQSAITIYASSDLTNWETLGSVTNPTGRLLIRDLDSAAHSQRFYRFSQLALDPVVD
jgi:hypothetical protein